MDFNFILDKNYIAYYILSTKMYNESNEIHNLKEMLLKDNDIGYKKILEQELLDSEIYLNDINIKKLIDEFINTNIFKQLYIKYNNNSKENIALKILKGFIQVDDNELERIKDNLWSKHMDAYRKLLNMNSYNPTIFLLDKDVMNSINHLKNTSEFKKIYEETKTYMDNVKKYWNEYKDKINEFLNKIIKNNLDVSLNVYVSHPNCYEGYSFGENNVAWGHYKGIEDPNYNLVYLVHEGLHHLIPFENTDNELVCYIKHSIIELASDYELYSLLKEESTLDQGHPYLKEYKEIIYPYWLRYIGLNDYQIKKRLEKDLVSTDNYVQIGDKKESNMDIYEFINFLITKWDDIIKSLKNNNKSK